MMLMSPTIMSSVAANTALPTPCITCLLRVDCCSRRLHRRLVDGAFVAAEREGHGAGGDGPRIAPVAIGTRAAPMAIHGGSRDSSAGDSSDRGDGRRDDRPESVDQAEKTRTDEQRMRPGPGWVDRA